MSEAKGSNGFSLDEFLEEGHGLCREERQYALFLYNCIEAGDKKIIEKVVDEGVEEILGVYYEATFMRDFFCEDRKRRILSPDKRDERCFPSKADDIKVSAEIKKGNHKNEKESLSSGGSSFNIKLFSFLADKYKSDIDREKEEVYINLNYRKIDFIKEPTELMKCIVPIGKAMMNAKPDIAIYYKKDSQKYLKFLECKYLSGESTYSGLKNDLESLGINESGQTAIQDLICEFLCTKLLDGDVQNRGTRLVKFEEKGGITIAELVQKQNRLKKAMKESIKES